MNGRRNPNPADSQVNGHPLDCFVTRSLVLNRHNFRVTALPSRIMYYLRDSWIDFPGHVVEPLKQIFAAGLSVTELCVGGMKYMFDFMRMLQFEFETGKYRSIAWIDEKGRCFFPKVFASQEFEQNLGRDAGVDADAASGVGGGVEVEAEIPGGKRKRDKIVEIKDEEEEVNSFNKHDLAVVKRPCLDLDRKGEKSKWSNARLLKQEEPIWVQFRNFFLSAMRGVDPGAIVTAIHQYVGNGYMDKARYDIFRRQTDIVTTTRGVPNMVPAWHGTSAEGVASILAYGFGMPSDSSRPAGCGVGVYFSPIGLPHLSAMHTEVDDNGEKHLVLCRVILGSSEQVHPRSEQSHPSSSDFDSGMDDPSNPKQYVLWYSNVNNYVFPEFVVSFKPSDAFRGRVGGKPAVKCTVAELFDKIRHALPPGKVKEMENLYRAFRAGQLAKDSFVKQIRSITGDAMLLAKIREIRGSG